MFTQDYRYFFILNRSFNVVIFFFSAQAFFKIEFNSINVLILRAFGIIFLDKMNQISQYIIFGKLIYFKPLKVIFKIMKTS